MHAIVPSPEARRIGQSIILFSGWLLVSSLVVAFYFDALMLDLGAIILLFMGFNLRDGFRNSIKWPAIFCGGYCLSSNLILIGLFVFPDRLKVGPRALEPGVATIIAAVALTIAFGWSLFNLRGLFQFRDGFVNNTERTP